MSIVIADRLDLDPSRSLEASAFDRIRGVRDHIQNNLLKLRLISSYYQLDVCELKTEIDTFDFELGAHEIKMRKS